MFEVSVDDSFAAAHNLRNYKANAKISTAIITKSELRSPGANSTKQACSTISFISNR